MDRKVIYRTTGTVGFPLLIEQYLFLKEFFRFRVNSMAVIGDSSVFIHTEKLLLYR